MHQLSLHGEWTTKIVLIQLSGLRNIKFFRNERSRQHLAELEQGLITLDISDERNTDPDPSAEQNATFDFIIENQQLILESLFNALRNKIYPTYQEYIDADDYSFPPLHTLNDLELVLAIRRITITANYKEGFAYYELYFDFSGDREHGLVISMHKDRLISFCGMGDNDGRAVLEDIGYDYDKWLKEYLDARNNKSYTIHKKIPKYGKLKPWQKDENREYLINLIRADDLVKLKQLIDSGEIDIEEGYAWGKTILCSAVSMNKIEAVKLLLQKGAKVGNAILECSQGDRYLKREVLKLLVDHGGNVDYLGYWKRTTLYYEIENRVNTFQNMASAGKNNPEKLARYEADFENHSINIPFLIQLGANPLNCDGEHSDYFTLLKQKWKEEYINATGIKTFVESAG